MHHSNSDRFPLQEMQHLPNLSGTCPDLFIPNFLGYLPTEFTNWEHVQQLARDLERARPDFAPRQEVFRWMEKEKDKKEWYTIFSAYSLWACAVFFTKRQDFPFLTGPICWALLEFSDVPFKNLVLDCFIRMVKSAELSIDDIESLCPAIRTVYTPKLSDVSLYEALPILLEKTVAKYGFEKDSVSVKLSDALCDILSKRNAPLEVSRKIFQIWSEFVWKLNEAALDVLRRTRMYAANELEELVLQLPFHVESYMSSQRIVFPMPPRRPGVSIEWKNPVSSLCFGPVSYLQEEPDFEKSGSSFIVYPIESFVPNHGSIMKLFLEVSLDSVEFANRLGSSYWQAVSQRHENAHMLDECGFYVSFWWQCLQNAPVQFPIPTLLFDPTLTVTEELFNLRYYVSKCILKSTDSEFRNFVNYVRTFPEVGASMAEIWVEQVRDFVQFARNKEKTVLSLLRDLFIHPDEGFDASQKEAVLQLECSVVRLLYHLFREESSLLRVSMEDKAFQVFLFALLFDEKIRGFSLSSIRRYINKYGIEHVLGTISDVFALIKCNFPDSSSVSLMCELMTTVNDSFSEMTLELSEVISASIQLLDSTDISQMLVKKSIEFHTMLSMSGCAVPKSYFSALERALKTFGTLNSEFTVLLIGLLSGRQQKKVEPSVFVVNGEVLTVMFRTLFPNSIPEFDLLGFCEQLCTYSFHNCLKLHECGFDLALLDILLENRQQNGQIVDKILGLFSKICTIMSSPVVVRKVFTLLMPIERRYIDTTHVKVVSMLAASFEKMDLFPGVCVPLPGVAVSVSDVNLGGSDSSVSVAFVCWTRFDSFASGMFLDIEVFSADRKHVFALSRKKSSLRVNNEDTGLEILDDKWTMIGIVCRMNGVIEWSINGSQPFEHKEKGMLFPVRKLLVNGTDSRQKGHSLFGGYKLMELRQDDDLLKLYRNGPRSLQSEELAKRSDAIRDFVFVFLRHFKLPTLIPLFAQLDLEMLDSATENESYSLDIVRTIHSLSMRQKGSDAGQVEAFRALGYIFENISPRHRTDVLYRCFYAIYTVLDCSEAKAALLDSVLLNFRIWIRAKGQDQLNIWRMLAGSTECKIPVKQVLVAMEMFYYYDLPMARDPLLRDRDLDVKGCRKEIANLITQNPITGDVLRFILISFTDLPEEKQQIDVLDMLNHATIQSVSEDVASRLYFLLTNARNSWMISLLRVISHIRKTVPSFPVDNQEHVRRANLLLDRKLDSATLQDALDMLPVCPEYFELVSSWVVQKEDSDITKMLSFGPSANYCVRPSWCRSCVQASLSRPAQEYNEMMMFLIRCDYTKWRDIYDQIVQEAPDHHNFDVQRHTDAFLMVLCKFFLQTRQTVVLPESMDMFYALVLSTIFFRRGFCHSEGILQVFRESPYDVSLVSFDPDSRYYYGIDVDADGMMKHIELATFVLSVFSKFRSNQDIRPFLVLAIHVARTRSEFIVSWFYNLTITERDELENDDLFRFLNALSQQGSWPLGEKRAIGPLVRLNIAYPGNFVTVHQKKGEDLQKNEEDLPEVNMADGLYEIDAVTSDIEESAQRREKSWQQLWRKVTSDGGPWCSPSSAQQVKWKRDPVLCAFMCPMKMKINRNFDDHLEASLTRELGSAAYAAEMMRIYRQRIRDRYQSETHSRLLEIPGDPKRPICQSRSASMIIEELTEDGNIPTRGQSKAEPSPNPKVANDARDNPNEFSQSMIEITGETKCVIEIRNDCIRIAEEKGDPPKTHKLLYRDILFVLRRTKFHRPVAMEVFCRNGRSYFLKYVSPADRDMALKKLSYYGVRLSEEKPLAQMTNDWKERRISTFEYLMYLNMISGRTFNDASQYPFLPWVIQDYQSEVLDLESSETFRDLSKPIGALDEQRLSELKDRMNDMKFLKLQPYLYSSYAVCPLSVYLWLIRMEPFTSMHIQMQSQKFDHGSRIFSSISDSYTYVCKGLNNYKELLPEFYCSPDFLLNENGFDMGKNREDYVNDVILPKWASSPMDFVYLMRKALESDYVSARINDWIDLVWGYKQRGKEAVSADNLYNPDLYDDVWKRTPPSRREEIETALHQIGHIPKQIFTTPHPKRDCRRQRQRGQFVGQPEMKDQCNGITAAFASFDRNTGKISVVAAVSDLIRYWSFDQDDRVLRNEVKWPLKCPIAHFASEDIARCQDGNVIVIKGHMLTSISVRATVIAQDGEYVGIVVDDSMLTVRSLVTREVTATIPFYGEAITCCSISSSFKLVACGTQTNKLYTCSIFQESKTRTIDLEGLCPRNVLITNAWGFIVVQAESCTGDRFILVFDVNGHSIRRVKVDFMISSWRTFTSSDGFDFILIATTRKIYVTEVFYCDFKDPITTSLDGKVLALEYVQPSSRIVAVATTGIRFIPFQM